MDLTYVDKCTLSINKTLNSYKGIFFQTNMESKKPKILEVAKNYFEATTAHGYSYVGNGSNWSLVETFFWICTVTISLIYCTLLVSKSFVDWNERKYTVRLDSFSHPAQVMQLVKKAIGTYL